jgi:hypothetical protein
MSKLQESRMIAAAVAALHMGMALTPPVPHKKHAASEAQSEPKRPKEKAARKARKRQRANP